MQGHTGYKSIGLDSGQGSSEKNKNLSQSDGTNAKDNHNF